LVIVPIAHAGKLVAHVPMTTQGRPDGFIASVPVASAKLSCTASPV
jgi:hypothetical protein